MLTKRCSCCKLEKPHSLFYKRKEARDGLQSQCGACRTDAAKKYAANNQDRRSENWTAYYPKNADYLKQQAKERYEKDPEKASARARDRYQQNKEQVQAKRSAWGKANLHLLAAHNANRRAMRNMAKAKWANDFFIQEAYHLARLRTELFGFAWHVDHIVPITSKLVCGLHTENNLQVIPALENMKKHNCYWPDMPCDTGVAL